MTSVVAIQLIELKTYKGRDTLLAYSLAFYNDFKLFIVLKHISKMFNDQSAHSAQCTVHIKLM